MNSNLKNPGWIALLILAWLFLAESNMYSQITMLPNGDKISFDGIYYDFRDSAGVQMIKLWVPPGIHPVRGVFISGHGGGGGDSRNFARDENIRAFAMRLGFAVAGLHNFPGGRVYTRGAPVFFNALNEFARLGHHPELANVPFVCYGSSNGGSATYGFVNYAPERAICFTVNVSAGGSPAIPSDAAILVPGIIIVGKFDALGGQRTIDRAAQIIHDARQRGARWCRAEELKGHEDGASFDFYMKLVEQAVALRYPANGNPALGPVKLIDIPEESGWLVDQDSWDSGLTYIDAYNEYKGDKSTAGWVLNKDMACVYRSLATHYNPFSISVREFDRTFNPNTDPGTMFSLGGPVASPGDKITLTANMEDFPGWGKIEFFNGGEKLGEVSKGQDPSISIQLDDSKQVYCLTALAADQSGVQRTCTPMHFFVKDQALSWKTPPLKGNFPSTVNRTGSKGAASYAGTCPENPDDSILVAYGLTGAEESGFSAYDNKISPFWDKIDGSKDYVLLTARRNAPEGSAFSGVKSNDCNMKVKAAYGSAGVYLLFEINDDNHVSWPNHLAGTENQQFYLNYDAVDMMIDSRSVESIASVENTDMFFTRSFGITTTSKQYQVACGTAKEKAEGFIRTRPEPWDMNPMYYTFPEAKSLFGIEIENLQTGYFDKDQEWFIPWSEYGGGLPGEPAAETHLSFTAGFNDRDEGEHFPPGVTSSGGTVRASNSLRWINQSDPWNSNKPPYNWGEIVLGPLLK